MLCVVLLVLVVLFFLVVAAERVVSVHFICIKFVQFRLCSWLVSSFVVAVLLMLHNSPLLLLVLYYVTFVC